MMSDIIERTLASVPSLITGNPPREGNNSRAFQNFVKLIGSCKTNREETQVVEKEIVLQKQKLAQPSVTPAQKRESLVRVVYCHMLGHDVSFAFIHAVKLAQQGTILEKRVGYLTCSLFLHDGHELVMLLINTIQKDLRSTNLLDVCAALSAASYLVSAEMMPALIPIVEEKLTHSREVVRKRAVICLHQFWKKAPDLVEHVLSNLPRALSDRDPSVVWASLHLYHDLIKIDPGPYRKLVMAFVGILEQIIARKLPKEYDYHTVPAPWMGILILKILAKLGAGHQGASEQMYVIIKEVMQRTEPTHKMGLAVIYECLETIATIHPHPGMIQHASHCTGRFLSASNPNLRYLGLKALTSIVKVAPQYAADHQNVVMECLTNSDNSLRRKTLELLYRMANPVNVQVICGKLLENLDSADQYLKSDIIDKVTDLVERFSADFEWYVKTTNEILLMSGELAPRDSSHKVVAQVKKAMGNSNEQYSDKCKYLTSTYMEILKRETVSPTILQISSWVLGEYSSIDTDTDISDVVRMLLKWFDTSSDPVSKLWIAQAINKICCKTHDKEIISVIVEALPKEDNMEDKEVKQRFQEIRILCQIKSKTNGQNGNLQTLALRPEKFDFTLSFLDEFVSESLEKGAKPYQPHHIRHPQPKPSKDSNALFGGLYFTPQSNLPGSLASGSTSSMDRSVNVAPSAGSICSAGSQDIDETSIRLKPKKRVWGKDGIIQSENTPLDRANLSDESKTQDPGSSTPDQSGNFSMPFNEDDEVEKEKKLLASALFSGLSAPPTDASRILGEPPPCSQDNAQSRDNVDNTFERQGSQGQISSGSLSLPLDDHQRLSPCQLGLLKSGDFQSPCGEQSMYSSFKMDDVTDPGYVSVNTYHSYPGAKRDSDPNSFWKSGRLQSDDYTDSLSPSDSPTKTATDSLMSVSDPVMKWQARLFEEDACTITEPSDSLENLSTACGSDLDDAPPMEFHNEHGGSSMGNNPLQFQRTLSMQSHDKLVVHECDSLHIEAVKRTLPENLELVLWVSLLNLDNLESDSLQTVTLELDSLLPLEHKVPDSSIDENGRINMSEIHCDSSGCAPITILLHPKQGCVTFPETFLVKLTLPFVREDAVEVKVPITPLDFIRPVEKSISEFSQQWPILGRDCKVNIPNNGNQEVETWTSLISEFAHFFVIQIQDEESLLCGEWLGKTEQILLHCRVRQDMVHLWVKSDSDSLLQMVSSCLSSLG